MSVVTFLFTDIEGSTRRWEADADVMQVALATHNKVLRGAVEANDGKVFNYTGDGMCAVFSSPRSAVDAAIAAQLELELPVRMGIATGEAELRQGNYVGTVLNRTARVMAAGHGGQILLDGATAALISAVDLIALGPRRLRDIAKPVDVFQVQVTGLRTDFPPLKTEDQTPGNLRPRSTTFIGRETELAELTEVLKEHRFVTLTGVGGVGKTRLALAVGARLADDFRDGVWVIELAAVGDPAAVADAVASVLGIAQQPGKSLADSVAAALEGRSRLLIFDNCEHVLDAAADMIEAILARSSTVKVLATSREGLRINEEQLWPVPSLDVDTGTDSAAAALFTDRALSVSPRVSLTAAVESAAVLEICRRLDGIPLAIELAASRLLSMTVTELRDRLDDRFRLLVGSRRGLERHQTLRHAVQWSYDLLDDTEKDLLARCSVFAGGFDMAAACAVADSTDQLATLDLLDALVRKSLVIADQLSGRTRFSMLETIRQFAEEQLVASGRADIVRNAHARYFAGREADVIAVWDSPRQREAYEWYTTELANLRAAFRWATDHGDVDAATAIAVQGAFLGAWVEQFEPVGWAEELIGRAEAIQHRRLAQLYVTAAQCHFAGRIEQAVDYTDKGLRAMRSPQFDGVEWEFETWALGGIYAVLGQPELWGDLCQSVIAREPGTHALARGCLTISRFLAGDLDGARTAARDLLEAADQTNNPAFACVSILAFGVAHPDVDTDNPHDAVRRGLSIARESGNSTFESHLALALARLAFARGAPVESLNYLALTISNYYDSGSFSLMANPLATLAAVFDQIGDFETAAAVSGFADTHLTRTLPELRATITHLQTVLGEKRYESLAQSAKEKSNAGMATYALEQIDRARTALLREETQKPPES